MNGKILKQILVGSGSKSEILFIFCGGGVFLCFYLMKCRERLVLWSLWVVYSLALR